MEFHAIRELRTAASGTGQGAKQAFLRLTWFERGRQDALLRRTAIRLEVARSVGRLAKDAYIDGFYTPNCLNGKQRVPTPLRAGSAEVRA